MRYLDPAAVDAECEDFRAALDAAAGGFVEPFLTAPSPGIVAAAMKNEYYDTEEAYLAALADALKVEYEAIVGHGFLLQLDCPDLALERHISYQDRPLADFLGFVERVVTAINRALENVPRERVRLHVCWGNYEGPHDLDVPLADILPIIRRAQRRRLRVPVRQPAPRPRVSLLRGRPGLDDDQILVAGVIDTLTNFVEHPEVVAERLERVAQRGRRSEARARRHRLRLRHLSRHGPGRRGRGLGQAQSAPRRRPDRLGAIVLGHRTQTADCRPESATRQRAGVLEQAFGLFARPTLLGH